MATAATNKCSQSRVKQTREVKWPSPSEDCLHINSNPSCVSSDPVLTFCDLDLYLWGSHSQEDLRNIDLHLTAPIHVVERQKRVI